LDYLEEKYWVLRLSDRPEKEENYHFKNHACDVRHVLQKEKIKEFTLIGHSLGGGVAINFIEIFKKSPKSLILIDTSYTNPFKNNFLFNLGKNINYFLRTFAKFQKIKPNNLKKEIDLSEAFKKNRLKLAQIWIKQCPIKIMVVVLDKMNEYTKINEKKTISRLKQFENPILVISSLFDTVVPAKFGEQITRFAKNSIFKIIKDVHHTAIIERADEVNTTILKFLKGKKVKEYF